MSKAKILCLTCGDPRGRKGAKGLCGLCYQRSRYKAGIISGQSWRDGITGTCTVTGCEKPIHPNGFKLQMCNAHALRMRRNGTLEFGRRSPNTMSAEERAAERARLWKLDYEKNSDAYKARAKAWAKANPAKASISGRRRTQALNRATPKWLTEAQWAEMNLVYDDAWSRIRSTGVKHEVDHMIPLRHKLASGLHVIQNLAVLPKLDNRRKSNAADLDKIAADHMTWLASRGLVLSG